MPIPPAVPAAAAATAAFPEARRGNAWDDWEEAYTRDEQPQADNVTLWQQANTFRPTYSILPSASNTTRLPPAAALSAATTNGPPVLKILKRPTAASTGTPGSASRFASSEARLRTEKTLAEREKEYLEARRRIYGEDAAGGDLQTGMAKMSLAAGAGAGSGKGSNSINTGARSGATIPSAAAAAGRAPRPNSRRGGSRSPATSVPNSASYSSTDLPSSASVKQGAARQPKGPNAQSGGFGFAAAFPDSSLNGSTPSLDLVTGAKFQAGLKTVPITAVPGRNTIPPIPNLDPNIEATSDANVN